MAIDSSRFHDEKYSAARAAGHPGWGGADRIARLPEVIRERFFSFDGLPSSGRLLELGCGAGNVSLELAKAGYKVSGVDFSETAIVWAGENAVKENISIDFRVGNVTDLSNFESETFDIVYDGNCIHCLVGPDRQKTLAEIQRVLKQDGILFVSSLSAPKMNPNFPREFDAETRVLSESGIPYRFVPTSEMLQGELIEAGFKILKTVVRADSPFGHINIHAAKT